MIYRIGAEDEYPHRRMRFRPPEMPLRAGTSGCRFGVLSEIDPVPSRSPGHKIQVRIEAENMNIFVKNSNKVEISSKTTSLIGCGPYYEIDKNGYPHRILTEAVQAVARAYVRSNDESRCVRRHPLTGRALLDREHTVRHEYLRGSQRPRPGDARECAIARRRRLRRYRFGIASRSSAVGVRRLRRRSRVKPAAVGCRRVTCFDTPVISGALTQL